MAPSGEQSRIAALLAGLPEAEASAVLQELWSLAGIEPVGGRRPAEIAHRLDGWRRRLAGMTARGVPEDRMVLAAAFGRAFGYYDGFLFEVRSAALDEERPVAAGGRYDGLPARLGGQTQDTIRTGAVGCMVRPARAYAGGGE